MTKEEILTQLGQFTGSSCFYRHWACKDIVMTDGVKFLAEAAECWWLIDDIAITARYRFIPADTDYYNFQVWKLRWVSVGDDERTRLTMQTDSDRPIEYQHDYLFCDFILDEIELWLVRNGDVWVLLLPSEY